MSKNEFSIYQKTGAKGIERLQTFLEQAKQDLVELCRRPGLETEFDISVDRYNMAREDLKHMYPMEVIFMLDGSGFINKILSPEEKKWVAERLREKNASRKR